MTYKQNPGEANNAHVANIGAPYLTLLNVLFALCYAALLQPLCALGLRDGSALSADSLDSVAKSLWDLRTVHLICTFVGIAVLYMWFTQYFPCLETKKGERYHVS